MIFANIKLIQEICKKGNVMNHVYVLIRTKLQFYSPYFSKQNYGYFCDALKSVLSQTYPNITIVILQDCWWKMSSKPQTAPLPKFCKKIVNEYKKDGGDCFSQILFYSANSRGAAHALYNIRQIVLKLSQDENDIVMMLDDDDLLTNKDSIKDIVNRLREKNSQVCITKFKLIGQKNLDIVNRGGLIHNKLVEKLDGTNLIDLKPGHLCFADSLGWTKSYRVSVLREYYDDLLQYFGSRKKMVNFFIKNDSFEDFPEIINLCRSNVRVVSLNKTTHSYRKHQSSITAKTKEIDFMGKRPAYLTLLMGLYGQIENKLKKDASVVISRYLVVKILTIENILAKIKTRTFRYKKQWYHKIDNGFFLHCLLDTFQKAHVQDLFLRIAIDAYKKEKQYQKFDKSEKYKSNISVIEKICEIEARRGYVDVVSCMQEKAYNFQVKRKIKISEFYVFIITLLALIILLAFVMPSKDSNDVVHSLGLAFAGAALSWIATRYRNIKTEQDKERKLTDMFSNAVDELRRHIIANMNVLLRIQEEMNENETFMPSKVHFTNLKIVDHSFFMSDKSDEYIIIDEFKQLSLLRVHIRNINNSANALEECIKDNSNRAYLADFIKWEVARYIGYIISLMYFNENRAFSFPNHDRLEIYTNNRNALEEIAKSMIPLNGSEIKKLETVTAIYNYYCNERKTKREVLNVCKIK